MDLSGRLSSGEALLDLDQEVYPWEVQVEDREVGVCSETVNQLQYILEVQHLTTHLRELTPTHCLPHQLLFHFQMVRRPINLPQQVLPLLVEEVDLSFFSREVVGPGSHHVHLPGSHHVVGHAFLGHHCRVGH